MKKSSLFFVAGILFLVWAVVPNPLVFVQKPGRIQFVDLDTNRPVEGVLISLGWSATWSAGLVSHSYHMKWERLVSDDEGYIYIEEFWHWLPWRPFFTISEREPSLGLNKALYVPAANQLPLRHEVNAYPYVRVHHVSAVENSPTLIYLEKLPVTSEEAYKRYIRSSHLGEGGFIEYCNNQHAYEFAAERDITEQEFLESGVLKKDWIEDIPEGWMQNCKELVNYLVELRSKRRGGEGYEI